MPVGGGLTLGLLFGLGSAALQAHQAGKAVKAETAASDKALALQKDIYQQQVANLAPFRNAGVGAVSALPAFLGLNLAGLGSGGAMQQTSGSLGGPQSGVTGGDGSGLPQGAISDPTKNGGFAGQMPGSATLGSTSYTSNSQAGGYGPQSSPIPNLRGKTPDGRIVLVPAQKAGEFQANGGTIIGGQA